jgi:hypothetical protein
MNYTAKIDVPKSTRLHLYKGKFLTSSLGEP